MLDVALAADQTEFEYENIRGTMVGLYCPHYMGGLNSVGWHFRLINEDRTRGGNALPVSVADAEASFDMTDGFEMTLSREAVFQDMQLSKDMDEAIHRAETATTGNESQPTKRNELRRNVVRRYAWSFHSFTAYRGQRFLTGSFFSFTKLPGSIGQLWPIVGIALLVFKKTKKTGAAVLLSFVGVLLFGELLLKHVATRIRPCQIDQAFAMLIERPTSSSYPSTHSAFAFAATDVLCGVVLGILVGLAAVRTCRLASKKMQSKGIRGERQEG